MNYFDLNSTQGVFVADQIFYCSHMGVSCQFFYVGVSTEMGKATSVKQGYLNAGMKKKMSQIYLISKICYFFND